MVLPIQIEGKAQKKMVDLSGQMGGPVLKIGDEVIVGFDQKAIEKALKK